MQSRLVGSSDIFEIKLPLCRLGDIIFGAVLVQMKQTRNLLWFHYNARQKAHFVQDPMLKMIICLIHHAFKNLSIVVT